MARPSVVEMAIRKIDEKIEELQRAKQLIEWATTASAVNEAASELAALKPRKPRRKRGLPAEQTTTGE